MTRNSIAIPENDVYVGQVITGTIGVVVTAGGTSASTTFEHNLGKVPSVRVYSIFGGVDNRFATPYFQFIPATQRFAGRFTWSVTARDLKIEENLYNGLTFPSTTTDLFLFVLISI